MILFVDDMSERFQKFLETHPGVEAVLCQTPDEACDRLLRLQPEEVWLDHDCGFFPCQNPNHPDPCYSLSSHVTFRPVACMLVAMGYKGVVHCHSGNRDGRAWMFNLLRDAAIDARDECLGFANGESCWD